MRELSQQSHITLLDGGMGRELLRIGAPFRQPEWSALALMEAPGLVKKAHDSFAAAGSDILTTSNYAVVPFHLGKNRFATEGAGLTALAGRLARQAASTSACRVAGSIPPLFGSYRPDLFRPDSAPELLNLIIDALSPSIDLWLAETISSISETRVVAEALSRDNRPLWVSFTLSDGQETHHERPCLRSGESVSSAANAAIEFGASAILFNCSQPEVMAPAIDAVNRELKRLDTTIPIGVYANTFQSQQKTTMANSTIQELRQSLDPEGYLAFAETWCDQGVSIIGGCCGIGPEHIAALSKTLKC